MACLLRHHCGKGCEACKECEHAGKKYGYTKSMTIRANIKKVKADSLINDITE